MTLKEKCSAHHVSPGLKRKAVVLQHQALHFTFLHPPWCMALQEETVSTVLPFLQVHKNFTFLCKKYFCLILIICCLFGRQATVTIFYSASDSSTNIFDSYFHTPTYALVSYIIKALKHFIHLTAPTCFGT
jgi:hypothetical protein